jgi:hypothetical protein
MDMPMIETKNQGMSIGQNNLPETLNTVADWKKNFEFQFSILQGGDNANM